MDYKLLEILACPLCRGKLLMDPRAHELICRVDKLAFNINDGIPNMVAEQARRLSPDE